MPVNPLEDFVNDQRRDFDAEPPAGLWDKISDELGAPAGESTTDEDELETFVRINRPAFDEAEPSFEVWKKIAGQLPGKVVKMIPRSRLFKYRVAAAVAVLVLATTLFIGRQIGLNAAEQQQLALIESVAPDFTEMESYYKEEIASTYQTVSQVNDDPVLKADLEALDQAMTELKEELINVPREERAAVIAKLIESYQIKLEILQNILDKLPPAAIEGGAKTNNHESISL